MPACESPWLTQEELLFHRMVTFHRERVQLISTGGPPVLKPNARILIVHLIPQECVEKRSLLDAAKLKNHGRHIWPLGSDEGKTRFNVDGLMTFADQEGIGAYSQLFRDGRLESLTANAAREKGQLLLFQDKIWERGIFQLVSVYLKFCKEVGLQPPIWLFAALIGCEGVRFATDSRFDDPSEYAIDRTPAFLPEIKIESLDINPATVLRPLCDAMWQSAGEPKSLNFDGDGNWIGQIRT